MTGEHRGSPAVRRPSLRVAVLVAAALAAAEGLAFLALGLSQLVVAGADGALAGAVAGAVFFGACAAGLGWCAYGLLRGQPWSRGPLVAAQLLLLAIAWTYHQPYPEWAALLAGGAGLCLLLLLAGSSSRELTSPGS